MNNQVKALLVSLVTIAVLGLAFKMSKTSSTYQSPQGKITVTTSFYPLYYFAKEVAGEWATVINLTPAGSEPHDYEPSPQDIIAIEKSRLLILNGGGLEIWADKIKDNLKDKEVIILLAGEDLISLRLEEGTANKDPHVWLSPQLAKKQVEKITQTLVTIDSKRKSSYQGGSKKLIAILEGLDKKYRENLKNCRQKNFITSHAAFGHLAQTYGLHQMSISGLSPDEEPSLSKLAEVAKFARENNIKYIFFESLVSPKLSQTIANEVGAKTLVLNSIEGLTTEEVQAGKNYSTLMEDNLFNLRIALECQ